MWQNLSRLSPSLPQNDKLLTCAYIHACTYIYILADMHMYTHPSVRMYLLYTSTYTHMHVYVHHVCTLTRVHVIFH